MLFRSKEQLQNKYLQREQECENKSVFEQIKDKHNEAQQVGQGRSADLEPGGGAVQEDEGQGHSILNQISRKRLRKKQRSSKDHDYGFSK